MCGVSEDGESGEGAGEAWGRVDWGGVEEAAGVDVGVDGWERGDGYRG